MKKLAFALVTLGIVIVAVKEGYTYYLGPCATPLHYKIGRFDKDFNLAEPNFQKAIAEAETVWEKEEKGRELFAFDPKATFTINLVYDERQAETEARRRTEFGLTEVENFFRKIDAEFNQLKSRYESQAKAYESALSAFESLQASYKDKVAYWNARGGAPKKEYEQMEQERQELSKTASSLNEGAKELNRLAEQVNALLTRRNASAEEYNRVIKEYNQKYGRRDQFDQAEYTGKEINVYQFTNLVDLKLALAHELGHALGMDHVENSKSIMYYLTQEGSSVNLSPTAEDLAELRSVCRIE